MTEIHKDGGIFLFVPAVGESRIFSSGSGGTLSAVFDERALNAAGITVGNTVFAFCRASTLQQCLKFSRDGGWPQDSGEKPLKIHSITKDTGVEGKVSVFAAPENWKPSLAK